MFFFVLVFEAFANQGLDVVVVCVCVCVCVFVCLLMCVCTLGLNETGLTSEAPCDSVLLI